MGKFFRGWRRKFGVVTLAMAGVLVAAWVRSLTVCDVLVLVDGYQSVSLDSVKGRLRILAGDSALCLRTRLVWPGWDHPTRLIWPAWHVVPSVEIPIPCGSENDPTNYWSETHENVNGLLGVLCENAQTRARATNRSGFVNSPQNIGQSSSRSLHSPPFSCSANQCIE